VAATGLADSHGLDAVSVRRVAAALQTRPMDLYRDFARKDELIDLMVDEAVAGAVLDELPGDWRDALAAIARALRAVCLAHPWVVTAAGRQALIGPNVMRHVEQSLEATAALGVDWTKRLAIWRAVDSYTMGHAHLSPDRDQGDRTTATDLGWRAEAEAYLQGLAGSGSFPNLAAFGAAGLLQSKYDELTFETGLGWLLTGIAADT
jgi:AcrR family transcriptional regulator